MQNTSPTAAPAATTAQLPDGFVKVEGGASEQVTETTSLIVAYSAIWLILMVFTLVTFRALRSLRGHARRADEAVRQLSHTPR
jgi:hypothetical protein